MIWVDAQKSFMGALRICPKPMCFVYNTFLTSPELSDEEVSIDGIGFK